MFTQQQDIRGGSLLSLSGLLATYKPKTAKWKHILEKHVIRNITGDRISLARHHWSEEQLEYIAQNDVQLRTTVPMEVAKATAYSFDSSAKWTHPGTGNTEYFHTPNVPKKIVQEEALLLFEPRTIRKKERDAKLKEHKLQEEKQAFEKLTFEQYQTQEKTLLDTIASLQQQVQTLAGENEYLKSNLQTVKKENQRLKNNNRKRLARKKQKTSRDDEEPFDMSQWKKPTEAQVRAAAAKAAQDAAAAIRQLPLLAPDNDAQPQAPQQQRQLQRQILRKRNCG